MVGCQQDNGVYKYESSPQEFVMSTGWKNFVENIRIEIDPKEMDKSIKNIQEQVKKVATDGRYTKVRVKYTGKQLGPDIPLGIFLAAEAATFWYAGLIRALVVNLGARSFIDIEFVHEGTEKVSEGRDLYADGEIEAAEECYREALRIRPDDPYAHYHLGVLLRVSGRKEDAKEHLQTAADTPNFEHAEKAQEILDRLSNTIRSI
jgi:tetratricopeptide (TPR) repeat protein